MPKTTRQLAAIMFTDIVGYTRLMGEDEQKAMQVLRKNREIHKSIIKKYHGKWLKEMGDGTLASFKTVSDAVYCAGELINACDEQDIQLRIGIHEGEVIEEDGDIFGDGVNIASRLEPLANPGQIMVSGPVHRNIKNKPGISSTFFKEAELKNVDEPVKIYQLSVDLTKVNFEQDKRIIRINKKSVLWAAGIALILLIGYSLSDYLQISNIHSSAELEKSIAVLPFKNMSLDEESQIFCDGQWEAILSKLSQLGELKVISRQSVEQYRESSTSSPQIANDLGVNYLLQGSVQKYGNQTKITVQLINAKDDEQLWSQDYTQEIKNIFSLQNEIAIQVAKELEVQLSENENNQIRNVPGIDPEIYELYLSAVYLMETYYDSNDSSLLDLAIERYSEVIQKAPNYSDAYVGLAWCYNDGLNADTCIYLFQKAVEVDENNARAHLNLGYYYKYYGNDTDQAAIEFSRTLELDPNNSEALLNLAWHYIQNREFEHGVHLIFKYIKINPSLENYELRDLRTYYYTLSDFFRSMGMYEEARIIEEKQIKLDPTYRQDRMAFVLTLMGKYDEALPYYKKQYEKDTTTMFFRNGLAQSYMYLKQWEMAEYYFKKSMDQITNQNADVFKYRPSVLFRYAYVLWQRGKKEEAKQLFDQHIKIVQGTLEAGSNYKGHLYDLAATYAFIGEKQKALQLLEQIPFWWVTYGLILIDPMFDQIRDDPAFQKIIRKQTDEMMELREAVQLEKYSDDLNRILNR